MLQKDWAGDGIAGLEGIGCYLYLGVEIEGPELVLPGRSQMDFDSVLVTEVVLEGLLCSLSCGESWSLGSAFSVLEVDFSWKVLYNLKNITQNLCSI